MQEAPEELLEMIDKLKYKDGWTFSHFHTSLSDMRYLKVRVVCKDSTGMHETMQYLTPMAPFYDYGDLHMTRTITAVSSEPFCVTHTIPIPPGEVFCGHIPVMRKWLMDTIVLIETHEACEFFRLPHPESGEYYVPFFPHNEDGSNRNVYCVIDKT